MLSHQQADAQGGCLPFSVYVGEEAAGKLQGPKGSCQSIAESISTIQAVQLICFEFAAVKATPSAEDGHKRACLEAASFYHSMILASRHWMCLCSSLWPICRMVPFNPFLSFL